MRRDLLLVALLAVAVYAATIPHPLLYDDLELIPAQPAIRDPARIGTILTGRYWGDLRVHDTLYRPLTIWTLALNHGANVLAGRDGTAPSGYRIVNVLLHAAASCAGLFLLRRLGIGRGAALAASLVFAAHPVHSEVVASVVNRSESLAALGGFLFLAFHRSGAALPAALALFLALLAKESAVAFAAVAVAMDVLPGRRGAGGRAARRGRDEAGSPHIPWARYAAMLAALVAWFALRWTAVHGITQRTMPVDNPLVAASIPERILTAIAVQGRYLGLLLWPARLSTDYSLNQVPVVRSPADPWFLLGILALVATAVLARRTRGRAPLATFALAAYVLASLPASNLLFTTGTIMAERLTYTPSFFLLLAIAGAVDARRVPAAHARTVRVLVAALVLILGFRTVAQCRTWRSADVFYESQVRSAPGSAKARYSWGKRLLLAGRAEEAVRENRRAIEILPDYADAWNNLAAGLEKQGDRAGAFEAYRRAAAIPPGHAQAEFNAGRLLHERGDRAGAIDAYRRALALDPRYLDALNNLGIALAELGRNAEAAAAWERALAVQPAFTPARENLEMLRSTAPGGGE